MKHSSAVDRNVVESVRLIESCVAEEFDITIPVLRARRGQRIHTVARHVAMYLARRLLPMVSVMQISAAMDRDHTTLLYALQNLEYRFKADKVLVERIERLQAKLIPLLAQPRTTNGKLASRLAGDIGRELGRAIGDEIGQRVATALRPVLSAIITQHEGEAS
jgi:hypothetical protein